MWILHFLPDSLILLATNLLLLLGVLIALAGVVAHKIPVFWRYQIPFKIVGLVLLAGGVYLRGGYGVEMAWRDRVAEVEAQLEEAKKQSSLVNEKIVEKVVYRNKVIKEQGETIIQKIDNIITVEKDCRVPQEAIDVHNEAARMNRIIEQQRKAAK